MADRAAANHTSFADDFTIYSEVFSGVIAAIRDILKTPKQDRSRRSVSDTTPQGPVTFDNFGIKAFGSSSPATTYMMLAFMQDALENKALTEIQTDQISSLDSLGTLFVQKYEQASEALRETEKDSQVPGHLRFQIARFAVRSQYANTDTKAYDRLTDAAQAFNEIQTKLDNLLENEESVKNTINGHDNAQAHSRAREFLEGGPLSFMLALIAAENLEQQGKGDLGRTISKAFFDLSEAFYRRNDAICEIALDANIAQFPQITGYERLLTQALNCAVQILDKDVGHLTTENFQNALNNRIARFLSGLPYGTNIAHSLENVAIRSSTQEFKEVVTGTLQDIKIYDPRNIATEKRFRTYETKIERREVDGEQIISDIERIIAIHEKIVELETFKHSPANQAADPQSPEVAGIQGSNAELVGVAEFSANAHARF